MKEITYNKCKYQFNLFDEAQYLSTIEKNREKLRKKRKEDTVRLEEGEIME